MTLNKGRNLMKKRIIVLLSFFAMTLLTVGCDKNSDSTDKNTKDTAVVSSSEENDTEEPADKIVSVDEFLEYYGVTETDIPREYILDFIMQYRLRKDTLTKESYWDTVSNDYNNGVVYGTDTGRIYQGTPSELPLEDYIKTVDVIVIEFAMYYGGELAYPRRLTLDLKNKKIYYATRLLSDYTDAEKSADLTDEDVQSIRDELPKHISEKQDKGAEYNLDYTFDISMKDPEYNIKCYKGNSGDEHNYPGFDAYWKGLYKEKFGEEFIFD